MGGLWPGAQFGELGLFAEIVLFNLGKCFFGSLGLNWLHLYLISKEITK